jgi:putative tryptophan/tyrosine transport system substrate-binding protein
MDRRTFVGRVSGGLLALPLMSGAQQVARLPRIGVLYPGKMGTSTEAMRRGLQELGYVEGRTAVIEWRRWERKPDRLRDAVAEMATPASSGAPPTLVRSSPSGTWKWRPKP